MYYVNGAPHSERSLKNQKIVALFAKREVMKNITSLVEYVFDTETLENAPPFNPGDIEYEIKPLCPTCNEDSLEEVVIEPHMVSPEYNPEADMNERYSCPICGMPYGTQEEARQCCVGQIAYYCTNCHSICSEEHMDELTDPEIPSGTEWYLVSDWLGKKLKEAGEPVILTKEYSIWGRFPMGGTLAEDIVLQRICVDIGILEGQPHEWPVQ